MANATPKALPPAGRKPTRAIGTRRIRLPSGYLPFLEDLKERIRSAQVKASLSVNRELIVLYWQIGRSIVERQRRQGFGKSVVNRLAADLQRAFPSLDGLSPSNIWRMRAFYLAWAADAILAPPVREMDTKTNRGRLGRRYREASILAPPVRELEDEQPPRAVTLIPWSHNVVIMQKVKAPAARLWYAGMTLENGWSRSVLAHQYELKLHRRQGKAVTNFQRTLPQPQSDLARDALKDPYVFDFLALGEGAHEWDLQQGLLEQIRRFLLELGVGFAFVGSQYRLEVAGDDFYPDLLFYHLGLRFFVVIDLKMEGFKPEFAGKMNFYLAAVDEQLRHPNDNPTVGIILCKTKKRLIAEYALHNTRAPIGVSEYSLSRDIPAKLKRNLPTIQEWEEELKKIERKKGNRPGEPGRRKQAGGVIGKKCEQ